MRRFVPGVYDIHCPRCKAEPEGACWNKRKIGEPTMWPHAERIQALIESRAAAVEEIIDRPYPTP